MNIVAQLSLLFLAILTLGLAIGFLCKKVLASFKAHQWTACAVMGLALALFPLGATKPNRAPRRLSAPVPVLTPISSDNDGYLMPTNFLLPTDLCFWLVAPETNAVRLGLTWPVESFPTNGLLDIFCSTQLTEDVWRRVAQIDVNSSVSNVLAEIAFDTDDA